MSNNEQTLKPKSQFWCNLGLHDWDKWKDIGEGDLIITTQSLFFDKEAKKSQLVLLQERRCLVCNKAERKYVKAEDYNE